MEVFPRPAKSNWKDATVVAAGKDTDDLLVRSGLRSPYVSTACPGA
ncbi:MAG: hypothetical protein HOY79_13155 [Streptomyces sp.]|nr:hypothetical protein [Streptomyces sp.]